MVSISLITTLKMIRLATVATLLLASVATADRLEVARCRAHCLDVLGAECSSGVESGACGQCWDTCDNTQWCNNSNCLDRGCGTACSWQQSTNIVSRTVDSNYRVQVWDLTSPLTIDRCQVSWGKLRVSVNSFRSSTRARGHMSPHVYIIIGQDNTGAWHELTQTAVRSHKLQTSWTAIRLIVVGEEGVRLNKIVESNPGKCEDNNEDIGWRPSITETIMDGQLVTVTLQWRGEQTGYIVRWQEYPDNDGMSVMASLVTQTAAASITLSPDTSYILQLQNINTRQLSETVIIDTQHLTTGHDVPARITIIASVVVALILVTAVAVAISRHCNHKTRPKNQVSPGVKTINNNVHVLDHAIVPLTLDYNNL